MSCMSHTCAALRLNTCVHLISTFLKPRCDAAAGPRGPATAGTAGTDSIAVAAVAASAAVPPRRQLFIDSSPLAYVYNRRRRRRPGSWPATVGIVAVGATSVTPSPARLPKPQSLCRRHLTPPPSRPASVVVITAAVMGPQLSAGTWCNPLMTSVGPDI